MLVYQRVTIYGVLVGLLESMDLCKGAFSLKSQVSRFRHWEVSWDVVKYPLLMTNSSPWEMAHRNRWFTVLKKGDFPWLC